MQKVGRKEIKAKELVYAFLTVTRRKTIFLSSYS